MIRHVTGGLSQGGTPFSFPETGRESRVLAPEGATTFRLVRQSSGSVAVITGSGPLVVDGRSVSGTVLLRYPHFIADSVENPSFLFGVDPSRRDGYDLWEVVEKSGSTVHLANVSRTFRKDGIEVGLRDASCVISPNQFVGVYGPSGSGKTTLVELILGLVEPRGGAISVDGAEPRQAAKSIGYLPQQPEMPGTIKGRDLIDLALANRGVRPGERQQIRANALRVAHLEGNHLTKQVGMLSGGQRRRLALACVLCRPQLRLLVADEPTSGLDSMMERDVMSSLRAVSRTGVTVFVVTHSADVVGYFDRVIVLRRRPDKAAELAYDGPWKPHLVDQLSGNELPTNVDRIGWLSSEESFATLPALHDDSLETQVPQLATNVISPVPPRRVAQGRRWWKCAAEMQRRDRGSVAMLLAMSLLCVILLQLGVGEDSGDAVTLGVLCAVAAPWLTAMYAATVTCSLLKLFSLESFSGARPLPFVLGVWSSFLVPAVLVTTVFALGLAVQPRMFTVIDRLAYTPADKNPGWFNQFLGKFRPGFQQPPSVKPSSWIGWTSPVESIRKSNLFPAPYRTIKDLGEKMGDKGWWEGIRQVFLGLLLSCALGCLIGMAAAAATKNDKAATVVCVVVFVVFLVMSRAELKEHALLGPCREWQEVVRHATKDGRQGVLNHDQDVRKLIPVFFSFASLSRYSFNILFFPAEDAWTLVWEASIAGVLFGLVPTVTATLSLRRRNVVRWYFSRE
jgi:ABC-type Mn2+/Zn2+ transport system ATPase subunit